MSDAPANTPDSIDMRSALWPAEDIGRLLASAASAVVTALEYHCNRIGEQPTNLSTLFVHYNARLATGQENANAGTTLEAAMKSAQSHGACRDATWPIDASKLTVKPPAHAYEEARKFAAIDYSIPADMLEALGMKYPVPFVASVPERCLTEAGKTGVLPPPTAEEIQRQSYMHHAMVLVGYDKASKTVLARNCWGKTWGVEGHCNIAMETLKIIAPASNRFLIITAKSVAAVVDQGAASRPMADAAAPAPPQRLADLAAKMREEIRGDVQKEIADATKRIRDLTRPPAPAPPQAVAPTATCPACSGGGKCTQCYGSGCQYCSYGSCPRCGGKGMV
jgi:hypothetical protein